MGQLFKSYYSGSKVSIKPQYIFHKNYYEVVTDKKLNQNRYKFDDNRTKGKISNESGKKLKNAINWLLNSTTYKEVFSEAENKNFYFKVNLITLDLPSTEHNITDEDFKKVLLHKFFNTAKYKFGLKNYVWKVETQSNGNIHAHITSDTFMHHLELRNSWNKILKSTGIIQQYQNKFSNMSLSDYSKLFEGNSNYDDDSIKKAYEYGSKTKWTNPNTTDVHSVKNIKNLGGYLAEYLGKSKNRGKKIIEETKEEVNIFYEKWRKKKDDTLEFICRDAKKIIGKVRSCRRRIKGRLWGCNYALSKANNISIDVETEDPINNIEKNNESKFHVKDVADYDEFGNMTRYYGTMLFWNMRNYKGLIKPIRDKILETKESIRHNPRVTGRLIFKYD